MPRVNIYLNDERLAKSKMISNFSEFVGSAIDNYMSTKIQPRGAVTMTKGIDPAYVNMEYPKISETISKIVIAPSVKKIVEPIIESGKVIKVKTKKDDKTYDFCKHDAVKGFCRSGCK